MADLESNLLKAISLCEGNSKYYDRFCRMYTFATENISEYLKYFRLQDKKVLTVGSSCDQAFNMAYYGARDITLYDVNDFVQYYFYLKMAAMLCLDYEEFQEFFFLHKYQANEYYNKKMFSKDTFNKIKVVLRLLNYESYLFFDELISTFSASCIRDHLFDDDECRNSVIINTNIYLKDKLLYDKMKALLKKINIKFIQGDIFKDNIEGKYDNIFLSNLLTVNNELEPFVELLRKLDNNLKDNGSMLVGYLWDIDYNRNYYEEDWLEAYKMPIVREKLRDYITEHHNVKDPISIVHDFDQKKDLVLIYRK